MNPQDTGPSQQINRQETEALKPETAAEKIARLKEEKAVREKAEKEAADAKAEQDRASKADSLQSEKQQLEQGLQKTETLNQEIATLTQESSKAKQQLEEMIKADVDLLAEIGISTPEDMASNEEFKDSPEVVDWLQKQAELEQKNQELSSLSESSGIETMQARLAEINQELASAEQVKQEKANTEKNEKASEIASKIKNGRGPYGVDTAREVLNSEQYDSGLVKDAYIENVKSGVAEAKSKELEKEGFTEAEQIAEKLLNEAKLAQKISERINSVLNQEASLRNELVRKITELPAEQITDEVNKYYGGNRSEMALYSMSKAFQSAMPGRFTIGAREIRQSDFTFYTEGRQGTSGLFEEMKQRFSQENYVPTGENYKLPEMSAQSYLEFLEGYEQVINAIKKKAEENPADLIHTKESEEEYRNKLGIVSESLVPKTPVEKSKDISPEANRQLLLMRKAYGNMSNDPYSTSRGAEKMRRDIDSKWSEKESDELNKAEKAWDIMEADQFDKKYGTEINDFVDKRNAKRDADEISHTLEKIRTNPGGYLEDPTIAEAKVKIEGGELKLAIDLQSVMEEYNSLKGEFDKATSELKKIEAEGEPSFFGKKKYEERLQTAQATTESARKMMQEKGNAYNELQKMKLGAEKALEELRYPTSGMNWIKEQLKQNPNITVNQTLNGLNSKIEKDKSFNPSDEEKNAIEKKINIEQELRAKAERAKR